MSSEKTFSQSTVKFLRLSISMPKPARKSFSQLTAELIYSGRRAATSATVAVSWGRTTAMRMPMSPRLTTRAKTRLTGRLSFLTSGRLSSDMP